MWSVAWGRTVAARPRYCLLLGSPHGIPGGDRIAPKSLRTGRPDALLLPGQEDQRPLLGGEVVISHDREVDGDIVAILLVLDTRPTEGVHEALADTRSLILAQIQPVLQDANVFRRIGKQTLVGDTPAARLQLPGSHRHRGSLLDRRL